MSEYSFVEKPFLDQLATLGWTVIDQGRGIPTDPAKSLRTNCVVELPGYSEVGRVDV
jgi:type I restriction enzyme R subunit